MAENVIIAAQAIDLTVIHPNETFSFNERVGVRSEVKGYKPGLMYSNGEVVMGVGGGICIVSTLLYNGALETGLKILDRRHHSGRVSYAEPGLDAAVAFGSADLCFKNTTGNTIIIRAAVTNDELVITLYGTRKPGQSVEVTTENYTEIPFKIIENEDETVTEGQVIVDQKARTGFDITTIRLIRQGGKLVSREIISQDTVAPRDKIMRVPPKPKPETVPLTVPQLEQLPKMPTADADSVTCTGRIERG